MDNKIIAIIAVVAVAIVAIAAAAIVMGGGDDKPSGDKVTYYANGGTSEQGTVIQTTDTVCWGNNIFTRDGYSCTGYNTKADGTGTPYSEGANVLPGTKLYAQWKDESGDKLRVTSLNSYTSKYNFYLGSSLQSATTMDKAGQYDLKPGYNIYIQVAGSSGSVSVADGNITIDVGDGIKYLVGPKLYGVNGYEIESGGMYAVISFTYDAGTMPEFWYVQGEN